MSEIPGPRGRRLVGNVVAYERDRLGFLRRCQDEFGDIFRYSPQTVVVCHPEEARDVYTRSRHDFTPEGQILSDPFDAEQMAARSMVVLAQRRHGQSYMRQGAVSEYRTRLAALLEAIINSAAGADIDVWETMMAFAGSGVADYCFSRDAGNVNAVATLSAKATNPLQASSLTLPAWLPKARKHLRAARALDDLLGEIIRERINRGPQEPPQDLLDAMLSGSPPAQSVPDLVELFQAVLRGAIGTPAAALSSIVRQLVLDPWAKERIRAETLAGDQDGKAPFTEAFTHEVLRLFPPVWLMGREVLTDTVIAGYQIHRGDHVHIPVYLMHTDPRWWDRPEQFDPGRWLGTVLPHARRAFLPFGAGPRMCFGASLGMAQIQVATQMLATQWRIDSPNIGACSPKPDLFYGPHGLRARFQPLVGSL
jgi:cytochrome P450